MGILYLLSYFPILTRTPRKFPIPRAMGHVPKMPKKNPGRLVPLVCILFRVSKLGKPRLLTQKNIHTRQASFANAKKYTHLWYMGKVKKKCDLEASFLSARLCLLFGCLNIIYNKYDN